MRNLYHRDPFTPRLRRSRRRAGLHPDVLWYPPGFGPFGPKSIWTPQEHEEYEMLKNETEEQWQRRDEFRNWMDKKNEQKRERSLRAARRMIRRFRCIRGVWKNRRDNERDEKAVKEECKEYETL